MYLDNLADMNILIDDICSTISKIDSLLMSSMNDKEAREVLKEVREKRIKTLKDLCSNKD